MQLDNCRIELMIEFAKLICQDAKKENSEVQIFKNLLKGHGF
jgi:hypothetical protein